MKTAVDSNILMDLLAGEPTVALAAEEALSIANASGPVVLCPVVYAEVATGFDDERALADFLTDLGLQIEPFSIEALQQTSRAWRSYIRRRGQQVQCSRCGRRSPIPCPACQAPLAWRQHLITDFLIGGHAIVQNDQLITRDTGYYRTYFPHLKLVVPGAGVL